MSKDSESFFRRTLEQKTAEARKAVDECIKQYLGVGKDKRQPSAQAVLAAVERPSLLLHPNDRPPWSTALLQELSVADRNSSDDNGIVAMQRIVSELYPQLS